MNSDNTIRDTLTNLTVTSVFSWLFYNGAFESVEKCLECQLRYQEDLENLNHKKALINSELESNKENIPPTPESNKENIPPTPDSNTPIVPIKLERIFNRIKQNTSVPIVTPIGNGNVSIQRKTIPLNTPSKWKRIRPDSPYPKVNRVRSKFTRTNDGWNHKNKKTVAVTPTYHPFNFTPQQ